jgi:hypothetical protein
LDGRADLAKTGSLRDDTNITINTKDKVVVEKLYLVMNMEDYWGMKDEENWMYGNYENQLLLITAF